jgi:hypothetical protein
MDKDILSSFGPTDAALLQIAGASSDFIQPIFTEDGKLARECQRRQLKSLRVAEVLSIWQGSMSKTGRL